jgi:hypothetical protein
MYFITFRRTATFRFRNGAIFPKAARKRYSIRARMRDRNMI